MLEAKQGSILSVGVMCMVLEPNCLALNPVCSLTNSKRALYLAFLDLVLPAYQMRKLEPTQR